MRMNNYEPVTSLQWLIPYLPGNIQCLSIGLLTSVAYQLMMKWFQMVMTMYGWVLTAILHEVSEGLSSHPWRIENDYAHCQMIQMGCQINDYYLLHQ